MEGGQMEHDVRAEDECLPDRVVISNVVSVQDVNPKHLMTVRFQPPREMRSDESGCPRHQDLHRAGFPFTVVIWCTYSTTTEPAPTVHPNPSRTPGRIVAFAPIDT